MVKVRDAAAFHGRRSEVQTDDGDDGARDDGGHQFLNPLHARPHDDEAHQSVDDAAGNDAPEGNPDIGIDAASGVARCSDDDADEGKGRTQVARDVTAHNQKEDEGADTAHQDGNVRVKAHQERCENRGTEHGDDVLDAERCHLTCGKPFIRPDDAVRFQTPLRKITHNNLQIFFADSTKKFRAAPANTAQTAEILLRFLIFRLFSCRLEVKNVGKYAPFFMNRAKRQSDRRRFRCPDF